MILLTLSETEKAQKVIYTHTGSWQTQENAQIQWKLQQGTQKEELTCNSEAMTCCRNWVFSVGGCHLSNWKNLNHCHQLHLCSNPSPHLLHHSQCKNCFLRLSCSSSFKLYLPQNSWFQGYSTISPATDFHNKITT